jgi:hypothetical protein
MKDMVVTKTLSNPYSTFDGYTLIRLGHLSKSKQSQIAHSDLQKISNRPSATGPKNSTGDFDFDFLSNWVGFIFKETTRLYIFGITFLGQWL